MAETENIGSIGISIVGDYSSLQADIDKATKIAAEGGQEIAQALNAGASGADALSGAMSAAAAAAGSFEEQIAALVNSGSTLGEALAQVQSSMAGIAMEAEGVGTAAGAAAEQMTLFDEAIQIPYADAAGQLNMFASELEPIPGAAQSAAQALEQMAKGEEDAGKNAQQASPSVEKLKEEAAGLTDKLVALGAALGFTAALVGFGHAALEAADAVDDAATSMALLSGNAQEANRTVSALRDLGKDAALELPGLLTAGNRMTAFLGSSKEVPGILRAVADSAAVMGTSVDAAAGGFERIIVSGDLSQRSLMRLGLTLEDVAKAMGKTAADAKDAFKELDQSEKINVMNTALGKFEGAAKRLSDDALGGLVRLGIQWSEVLEEIGKALDPVIKGMTQFASENILPAVKGLAEAFASLPDPVKNTAVGLGLALAAIVPLAAAVGGATLAWGALAATLAPVGAALAAVGVGITGVGASYATMIAGGVLATAGWVALAAAILYAANAYWEMKKAQDGAAQAQKESADATSKLEIALRRQGIQIDDLANKYRQGAISETEYIRGLRDLVIEHQKTHPVLLEHAEAMEKAFSTTDAAKIKMQSLGEAVASTRKHLDEVTAKYNEHKATTADVAKAYDAWQGATNALKGAQQALLPVVTNVHQATKEFVATQQRYVDMVMATEDASKALTITVEAQTKQWIEAQGWFNEVLEKYNQGRATFGELSKAADLLNSKASALNKTMEELAKAAAPDMKTWTKNISEAAAAVSSLVPAVEAIGLPIKNADFLLRDMGITISNTGDILQNKLIQSYVLLGQTADNTLEKENTAWSKIAQNVNKLAEHDLPAAIKLYNQHLEQVQKLGGSEKELLDTRAAGLQLTIRQAEESGKSATSQIIGLKNVQLQQQALYDSTHMMGQLYSDVIDDILKGWSAISGAVVDAIFEGKNFGESMIAIAKQVAKSIMDDLVGVALKSLKNAFIGVGGSIDDVTKKWKDLATAITGANDAAGKMPGFGGAGAGKGGALNMAGDIASIGTLISSIFGNFQMAAVNKSLDIIVEHTLRIFNVLDQWYLAEQDWFGQMFTRTGEIWRDMIAGFESVVAALGGGGTTVVPPYSVPPMAPGIPDIPIMPGVSAGTYGTSNVSNSQKVGAMTFNVFESANPRETARAIATTLRTISPRFAAFSS